MKLFSKNAGKLIRPTYGKVSNGTTDEQTHDDHSLVLTARHSTSTSWRSDAPIILSGWEYHTRGSRLTSTVPECRHGGRLWMAHQHHHRQHKSPRKTTTHSSMEAESDRFIRSVAFGPTAGSLISTEGRISNSGSWSR